MILLPLLVTFSVTLEVLPAGTFETPKANLIGLRAFTAVSALLRRAAGLTNRSTLLTHTVPTG